MITLCPWCREAFDPSTRQSHTCALAPTPEPDHVRVSFSGDPDYMTIDFVWRLPGDLPLDRPHSYGISCLPRHIHRLTRAFLTGNLFEDPRIGWDIYGHTYTMTRCKVWGKRINKDLTDLGF